ncbi:hypothetical protein ACFFX0_18180 [Citricoccus parietis]|uniref:Uncharacterized protein n=1 Tax=Citricoccus parietis TaxID=592307 RepID=A0ABV5G264_9MICC
MTGSPSSSRSRDTGRCRWRPCANKDSSPGRSQARPSRAGRPQKCCHRRDGGRLSCRAVPVGPAQFRGGWFVPPTPPSPDWPPGPPVNRRAASMTRPMPDDRPAPGLFPLPLSLPRRLRALVA